MPFERVDESVRVISDQIERSGSGITMGADKNVAPPFEEYSYPNSFARAIADDLAASGLFRRAGVTVDLALTDRRSGALVWQAIWTM